MDREIDVPHSDILRRVPAALAPRRHRAEKMSACAGRPGPERPVAGIQPVHHHHALLAVQGPWPHHREALPPVRGTGHSLQGGEDQITIPPAPTPACGCASGARARPAGRGGPPGDSTSCSTCGASAVPARRDDLYTESEISFSDRPRWEASSGADHLDGKARVTIPPERRRTRYSGSRARACRALAGRRGDQFVRVRVVTPASSPSARRSFCASTQSRAASPSRRSCGFFRRPPE